MNVPLLDLKAQYRTIQEDVNRAIQKVLAGQRFILGATVEQCEQEIARYSGAKFACGVSSGTDALLISLLAEGVRPGDEVITSAYSFFATAGSIVRAGATPVFVDILPDTFNLDPAQVKKNVGSRTKAIIPVHLFGQTADLDPIIKIAGASRIVIIEDAAQAIGAEYKKKRAGSIGGYGCLSFFPTKNLGGYGDGGMVLSNDKKRQEKLCALRAHGQTSRHEHAFVGGNFRLDALQAAVISAKLKHLDGWSERRRENAFLYDRLFKESGVAGKHVTTPKPSKDRHVYNQYVIRTSKRDALASFLSKNDIGHSIYYPVPLPFQPCFSYLAERQGEFPESERAAKESLALPIYPELTKEQIAHVAETIAKFFRK